MYRLASLYIMRPKAGDLSFFNRTERELKISLFSGGWRAFGEDGEHAASGEAVEWW